MVARLLWVSKTKQLSVVLTKRSQPSKELKGQYADPRNDYATCPAAKPKMSRTK